MLLLLLTATTGTASGGPPPPSTVLNAHMHAHGARQPDAYAVGRRR